MNKPCEGKVKYTRSYARRVARDMTEKYQELLLAYKCHECKGWHVGHPNVYRLNTYQERNYRHGKERRNDRHVVV